MTAREAGFVAATVTTRRVISGRRVIISPLATDNGSPGRYAFEPRPEHLQSATSGRESLHIRSARGRIPVRSRIEAFRFIGRHDISARR
jgi:hypothetical protein